MNIEQKLSDLRKLLHQNPETSFNEYKTQEILSNFIENETDKLPHFKIKKLFETSIIVEYVNTDKKIPFKLFRADMDALPVSESETNPIVSKHQGVMHACGHDIHMSILAGLISYTAENLPEKNILFVFQPAEEGAGGAKKMMDAAVFDNYNISAAFALHVTDDYGLGEVATNDHILFAIPREINIVFSGKSAHAAFPHKGNDVIAAASSFLTNIHHVLAKKMNPMNPFLIHFGKIEGGEARNITARECILEGTLRALSLHVMNNGSAIIEQTAKNIANSFGCTVIVNTLGEFLPVINDQKLFRQLKKIAKFSKHHFIVSETRLVGEDFGYFCHRYPSIMFWLGTKESGKKPKSLHSPYFFPTDKAIISGLKIMSELLEHT